MADFVSPVTLLVLTEKKECCLFSKFFVCISEVTFYFFFIEQTQVPVCKFCQTRTNYLDYHLILWQTVLFTNKCILLRIGYTKFLFKKCIFYVDYFCSNNIRFFRNLNFWWKWSLTWDQVEWFRSRSFF